jgi:hypothetical protein
MVRRGSVVKMSSPRQAGQKNSRHTVHHACLSGANYIIMHFLSRQKNNHEQAFSQKGVQASWDAPGTKNGRLLMSIFGGGGGAKLFSITPISIYLIYLKRNSFNSHYYYTLDSLINLMVYLAE